MNMVRLAFVVFFCFNVVTVFSQSKAFGAGEKLFYEIKYEQSSLWTVVGEASILVEPITVKGKALLHLNGKAKTYPSYDVYFSVRDSYESFVIPEGIVPVMFERKVWEGSYFKNEKQVFKYANKSIVTTVESSKRELSVLSLEMEGKPRDVVSFFYYFRSLNLAALTKGLVQRHSIVLDNEYKPVNLTFLGIDNVTISNLGMVKALKFKINMGASTEKHKSANIWISNDKNKIPVYIEAYTKQGGKVKIQLIKYQGLTNEFSSLIKSK